MNQINQLEIYRTGSTWAFDDETRDLLKEPFVSGVDEILNYVIGPAHDRAIVTFSKDPFPTQEKVYVLVFLYESEGGAWYQYIEKTYQKTGWFCPAFWKYFDTPPNKIHFTINRLK